MKALITGITGQDGSYLAEFLLDKGYEVHGLVRRVALEDSNQRLSRINHIKKDLILHPGGIESYPRLIDIFEKVQPDETYHLAAQSFVHESFEDSNSTFMTNVQGTLNVLNALKNKSPLSRFYFAGSSEMFGLVKESPQSEETPFHPRSPYGITKVTGFDLTRNFRESYNLFGCSGILFNHESPRRGQEFVTRKITSGVARINRGDDNVLILGNLDAKRDWGFAGDYVEAMWLMLQQNKPDDYVIATGKTNSIRYFVDLAFNHVGMNYEMVDLHDLAPEDANKEIDSLKKQKNAFVIQHPSFYRPAEVEELLGDPTKANKELGWEADTSMEELVKMMVGADLKKYFEK
jgi:GDPmannose 4,6-dehydratase